MNPNILPTKTFSPTVLSSDKSEQISSMKKNLTKMMMDRPFIGPDGLPRYADGAIMPQQQSPLSQGKSEQ